MVTLTNDELVNAIKEAVVSILLVQGLSKKNIIEEFRTLLLDVLQEIVPKHDPEEDILYTTEEAAAFFGLSRQAVQGKKDIMVNGKPLLEFQELGPRIHRITKAECRRALKRLALRPHSLKRRDEFPERHRVKKPTKKS